VGDSYEFDFVEGERRFLLNTPAIGAVQVVDAQTGELRGSGGGLVDAPIREVRGLGDESILVLAAGIAGKLWPGDKRTAGDVILYIYTEAEVEDLERGDVLDEPTWAQAVVRVRRRRS
jgi:hypothetical protein